MIDFDNDGIDLMADALRPLVGQTVAIDVAPKGYEFGQLVNVELAEDGPYIDVRRFIDSDFNGEGQAHGETIRLHASVECNRIRVCG